jgi:hypothetical protein
MKYFLFLSICLFSFASIHAQPKRACDSIYREVDSLASYPGGNDELIKFMNKEMRDAFNDCYHHDSTMITGMTIDLVISNKGKVLEATFTDVELAPGCRDRLRKKLLAMKTWVPARHKGVAVCSHYAWLVGGVLWEDQ